eukprot:2250146-Prymnesium_polylepis.1
MSRPMRPEVTSEHHARAHGLGCCPVSLVGSLGARFRFSRSLAWQMAGLRGKAPAGEASFNRFYHDDDGSGQRERKTTPDVERQPEKRKTGVIIDVDTGKYAGAKLWQLEEVRRHFARATARAIAQSVRPRAREHTVRWAISAGRLPTSRRRSL